MNARTTVSSGGQIRRAFSVRDVERMVEVGIIEPDERLEIVAGEILPMSPKGNRHEVLKQHLNRHFGRQITEHYAYVQEAGWHREGVRDFWVVDAATRETHVHLTPSTDGYDSVRVYPPTIELAPEFVGRMTVRMGDLPAE